ncbi:ABC transporter substrate-binding protein [Comamonas faecalis]|uniref:ABC transporter substrate-binding protein n=1 Tax=Comamonas faecalis TaxID=1387849 RepID=A0ABP7R9H4_9BURK
MNRRNALHAVAAFAGAALTGLAGVAHAADEAPDALVRRLSGEVLETVRNDAALKGGDIGKIMALVNKVIMPHVNFRRMTAAAVGPGWRSATLEQRQRLQDEFKTLLVRTYSGALNEVTDQSIVVKPLRMHADDKDVLVRTEVRGRGDPVQLDYRLERTPGDGAGWKIYNLNVLGVWLVETYRSQFAPEVNARGIDGLIDALAARNQANAARSK